LFGLQQLTSFPLCLSSSTGVESSVWTAAYSLRFGGKVFIIGVGKEIQSLPFMHMSAFEIDCQWQ
jgi:L-iditol 2-dehydrogenase